MGGEILNWVPVLGASCLALACAVWAAASNAEARRIQNNLKSRLKESDARLEHADAVLSSDPGLVLVWGDSESAQPSLPVPAAFLPKGLVPMAPNSVMGDFEKVLGKAERTPAEQFRTLLMRLKSSELAGFAQALADLRDRGTPFSMVVTRKDRGEFEAIGQTVGARAVVRIRDVTGAVREVKRLGTLLEETEIERRKLSALLHALPQPAWIRDETHKLIWLNAAYAKAVDQPSPELALEKGVELAQGGEARAHDAITGNHVVEDRQYVIAEGKRRAMDLMEFPLPNGSGGIAIDQTEADELTRTLEKSQDAHDSTLDRLTIAVAIFDADKSLRFSNRAFASLWGLDRSWLASHPPHGEILDRLREARRLPEQRNFRAWKDERLSLYAKLTEIKTETWHLPDDRTIRILARPHPLGGLILVYEDVTERFALESQVATLVEVQRKTLDHLDEGVAVFGTHGRLELHNSAFEKIWRLSPSQLDGSPHINEVIALCKDLFDTEPVWRTIRGRVTGGEEARTAHKDEMRLNDGSLLHFEVQPLRSGQTLVTFLDQTAQDKVRRALRERNEALETADRLKSAFIENVSYQLRNPLNSILGFSEFLQTGIAGELNEKQGEYVGDVIKGANQLRDLIDDILDLAMIEAGTMTLDISEVDVLGLLEGASSLAISRAEHSAVPVRLDVDAEIGTIEADERRLRQVLFTLMSNAIRHSREGDEITLGAKREAGQVIISVKDTGPGLPPDVLRHAFDSFASEDTGASGRRAGLGLALVKSFIDLHGGWVTLDSTEGEGTVATFALPEHAAPSEQVA